MRLPDSARTTQRLGDLLLETPAGWIPARQIADIKETDGPNQILRENGRRRIVVLANSDGTTDVAKIVDAMRGELRRIRLPDGYFTSLEGTFRAQEEASRTIGFLSIVSLSLIFIVLYSRYRSIPLALIIMGSVPLALIGSVAALWVAGQPLSVASMIGFITLTGIATRNGILKISHTINLSLHEGMPWGSTRDTRQHGENDAGAYDRARGGRCACAAPGRRIDAWQGNSPSGGGDDLWWVDQRHLAGCVFNPDPVSELWPQRHRAAATTAARFTGRVRCPNINCRNPTNAVGKELK